MKTRDLSRPKYLKRLQMEFFSYVIRSIIYSEPYRSISDDIARKKREKIISIGKRFALDTIFDSREKFISFYENKFLKKSGFPNFTYAGTPNDEKIKRWDNFYLLKRGTRVRLKEDPHNEYIIEENDLDNGDVLLEKKLVYFYKDLIINHLSYEKNKNCKHFI